MAPHGAPGAQQISSDIKLERESEKRIRGTRHSQSITGRLSVMLLRAPVAEGADKVQKSSTAQETQCCDNITKSRYAWPDEKAPPVFQRSQLFFIILCLLFHHSHAGRILMYLPVATRYESNIFFKGTKTYFSISGPTYLLGPRWLDPWQNMATRFSARNRQNQTCPMHLLAGHLRHRIPGATFASIR